MANESWLDDIFAVKSITKDGGAAFPKRTKLNFTGAGVSVADNPSTGAIDVTIPGGAGGTSVQYKDSCRVATTANTTLSGLQTIDGVTVIAGDRVLVKNQATASQNGVYVAASTAWARATDADTGAEVTSGMIVPVDQGSTQLDSLWMLTTANPITLGVSSLAFKQIDSINAVSLSGKALDAGTVGSPSDGFAVVFDNATSKYKAMLLLNKHIDASAAIAASKLAAGTNGQVIKTVAGTPGWSTPSFGDFGETVITPGSIGADQNDYSPAGWSTATIVRLSATGASRLIRGFDSTATVKRKLLVNIGNQNIRVSVLDLGQAAGNWVLAPEGNTLSEFQIAPCDAAELIHDGTSWWIVGRGLLDQAPAFTKRPLLSGFTDSYKSIPLTDFQKGYNDTAGAISGWFFGSQFALGKHFLQATVARDKAFFPIRLASGAVLRDVYCIVAQSAAPSSSGNSMRISAWKQAHDYHVGPPTISLSQLGSSASGTTVLSNQIVGTTLNGLMETIDNNVSQYWVAIEAQADNMANGYIFDVGVHYTPGPLGDL